MTDYNKYLSDTGWYVYFSYTQKKLTGKLV
jgi:hypothetical protein